MDIFVAGTGMTQFGEHFDKSLLDLAFEAADEAIRESGIEKEYIDAVIVGNMLGATLSDQGQLGAAVASRLELNNIEAFRVEAACASGGVAIKRAYTMLRTGDYQNVLVVGVEKMSDHTSAEVTAGLAQAADAEIEGFYGLTFPSLYAMMAQRYMHDFTATSEDLARVAVKNHYHGARNVKAQFPKEITTETVLKSVEVASPLRLFDCSPISDGAAAVILSTQNKQHVPVKMRASEIGSDSLALQDRESLTSIKATQVAAYKAMSKSGARPQNIDVLEVHDCFTIAELLAIEDLGFAEPGRAVEMYREGKTYFDNELPVNTSGGLKSCGHPVGATGVKQIIELTHQLQGRAGERQVKDPHLALAQNVGGSGATCVVSILSN
jgi:acetyl-CoA C-acetyltransferase